jgi:hypothetical protein
MLDELQTHRQILFDITANYLEQLDGAFCRLAYLANLRDSATGTYVHDRLAAVYSPGHIDQVVARCHEEVFERLLEMPLASQGNDLRKYLNTLPGSFDANAGGCADMAAKWIPAGAPSYLRELFCSNLNALGQILLDKKSTAH